MSFNYTFRFIEDEKEVIKTITFLEKQPFDYPKYMDWLYGVVRRELLSGYKKSILAFSDGDLVGNLIFQPHKTFNQLMELKNMRVHPKVQARYFGVFMVKQAEVEARGNYDAVICDARSDRKDVINLLKFLGYRELARTHLYNGAEDVVMVKSLRSFINPSSFTKTWEL